MDVSVLQRSSVLTMQVQCLDTILEPGHTIGTDAAYKPDSQAASRLAASILDAHVFLGPAAYQVALSVRSLSKAGRAHETSFAEPEVEN